ncbi:FUSC family protein [Nocardia sp. 348MFTsu5.1]|uniref:FUSC family protein n=1 Tax=Nocardia sp. 348MFTsu5.1 TaxID=1172185 RepID=UPI00035F5702|nr:FUSC family protein [Nocardia sp. 348MFTsu5.1]
MPPARLFAWSRTNAIIGAAAAIPAVIVAFWNIAAAAALGVGVLPAAVVGIPPQRRARIILLMAGFLIGVPMMAGSLVAPFPVVAVPVIFALALGAVLLAGVARFARAGQLMMTLAVPMVGVGLSYDSVGESARLTLLFIGGSALVWLLSLTLPERESEPRDEPAQAPGLSYGLRLGAAGALAAAIGFAFDFDHVGWACAAALMVMRPVREVQISRMAGRLASVIAGATVAVLLIEISPPAAVFAAIFGLALTLASATRGSRFYILPAFTTFFVIMLLGYSNPDNAPSRLFERINETALGIAIALFFGILLPALMTRLSTNHPPQSINQGTTGQDHQPGDHRRNRQ